MSFESTLLNFLKLSWSAWVFRLAVLSFYAGALPPSCQSAEWKIIVEEPTGLYPRTNEVVAVPFSTLGQSNQSWLVTDAQGVELPWQATDAALLFPATLIPGELPDNRVKPGDHHDTNFTNGILVRQLGLNRVELGNRYFRVLVDLAAGAITEAYNLRAETYRTLNLVETTPEEPDALKDDIHAAEAMGIKPVPGVPAGNIGWTSLGATGAIARVDILEGGPLRGRLQLSRKDESWELVWTSESPILQWRARKGFRFTAISAAPYLPFDRFLGGSEYEWPNGPDDAEPPDHEIGPRPWQRLPGGHAIYYHHAENYGALGIICPGTNLTWAGIGSRRFIGKGPDGPAEIAVSFPLWAGSNTVLQARREYRVFAQPLLVQVRSQPDRTSPVQRRAERDPEVKIQTADQPLAHDTNSNASPGPVLSVPEPYAPNVLSLDGDWELAWCEKGQGPPTNGWRSVKVPGSAHVQWLARDQIYTRDAEWVSGKEWWYPQAL